MNILILSESFIIRDSIGNLFNDIFQSANIDIMSAMNSYDYEQLFKYDFIFIDINKNNFKIIKNLSEYKIKNRNLRVLVLDVYKDKELFIDLSRLGLDGYISSISDKDEFIYVVNKVIVGKKYYDSELLEYVIRKPNDSDIEKLTPREIGVLKQVAKGYSNKEIASNLNVTDCTIKKHISKILNKLNLKNRQDIIIYARDNNIIEDNKSCTWL